MPFRGAPPAPPGSRAHASRRRSRRRLPPTRRDKLLPSMASRTSKFASRAPARDVSPQSARSMQPASRSPTRSEEHTSELQSLMRISYAVFCLKKKIYISEIMTKHHTERNKQNNPTQNITELKIHNTK